VLDADSMTTTRTSDAELEDRIQLELKWAPGLDKTLIEIAVADGSVTLTGSVVDFSQIGIAERATWKVPGVVAVAQDIEIMNDSIPVSDTDIAHNLAVALGKVQEIPAGAVHSTVTRGCVFLGGVVAWDFQSAAAERAAASVPGVRRVRNSIEVSPSAAAEHIGRHIEAELEHDMADEMHRISISADGAGHVVLAGTARSVAECNALGRAARRAAGVETVRNLVRVVT
jgi:osmotically-inducible protein OsmY